MPTAPIIPNEAERLEALRAFGVLDTPPEAAYDDLTRLAGVVCAAPMALVSLVDRDRQWFKSCAGLGVGETPRDVSFCAHALAGPGLFVVPDAALDPRFCDNPLVTGTPFIRFYAGAPLVTPEGHALGTLCVLDRAPRDLSAAQRDALEVLARQVVAQLLLRRQVAELEAEVAARAAAEGGRRATEERFRAFMDNGPAMAYMKDAEGRFVYVNRPLCERFGTPEAGWLGRTDADLWPPAVAGPLREVDRRILAGGALVKLIEHVPTPDGASTLWQSYKFPFTEPGGRRLLAGMSVDVTAERLAEDALRASEAKFRSTVDRLAEGLFVVDAGTGRFVEANAAFLATLGYTAGEFAALAPFDLVAGESPEAYARNVAAMRDELARAGRCDVGRRQFRRKDGSAVPVDVRVTVVPNGGAGLHAVIVRDVTEQVEYENRLFAYQSELEDANARLKSLATTDGLTGVKNRAAFDEKLAEEAERAARHGRALSVILLDVDHFKRFNDAFGHPAGDAVLAAVAAALARTGRGTDFVARYGGEEFALVLPDTDYAGAMVVAERCRRAVAAGPWDQRPITVSVGVATRTAATPDAQALVREADRALYRSKEAGRNRVNHGSSSFALPASRGR